MEQLKVEFNFCSLFLFYEEDLTSSWSRILTLNSGSINLEFAIELLIFVLKKTIQM